jgi:hypothetical protein
MPADLGSISSVENAVPADTIAVPHVQQTQPVWCWAACCEMVTRHYATGLSAGPVLTQGQFATAFANKFQVDEVSMAAPNEVNYLLRKLAGRDTAYWTANQGGGPPSWDAVCSAINRGQLIILSAFNHAVVIAGYRTTMGGVRALMVHDPARADGPVPWEWDRIRANLAGLVWVKQTDPACLD